MRLTSLVLLGLLTLPARSALPTLPPPPAPFAAADQEIDALQAGLNALRREAEALLADLAGLEPRYHDAAGFEPAGREREPLRAKVAKLLEEISAGELRFNELREQTQMQKVVAGLQAVMKKGDVPQAAGVEFVRSNERLAFAQEVQRFREKAVAALRLDEEAYRAAEARAELDRRRGLETWAVAAGAFLVLVILALLIDNARLRRALRPKAALPPPTGR